ncbi:MAG TPA: cobalamin biosynthesis protein CbiX [Microbacteriaceae bacterium]|nr:cobalamin biosynthesis protein CbiX [Microbacteriaceae bacterium]
MRTPGTPVLLAASHGTNDRAGQDAVARLVGAVSAATPHTTVRGSFVDVQQPGVAESLGVLDRDESVVIVPLLLSAGYHVRVDLAEAASRAAQGDVRVTGALGPDERLTGVLAARLHEAGLRPTDNVVLAAAGSSDASAVADCHRVSRQLAALLERPVTVGFLSAAEPRLRDAVDAVRAASPGRVVVASYLLAPGYFAGLARSAGADVVSAPLLGEHGDPPTALVEIVIDLYRRSASGV